jgi:polyisoprenyl-phosphate glycosyltransferase
LGLEGTRSQLPRLGIVVPCFNEEQVLRETGSRLLALMNELLEKKQLSNESFIYFVDDGSRDATWSVLCEMHQADPRAKALKLSRNFGHQNALLAGLMTIKDRVDCAVTLDADLQHNEQAIASFVEKYKGGAEIVFGVRNDRATDPYLKKVGSQMFYRLMRGLGVRILADSPDYRLVSTKALNALADYQEVNLFLRGVFLDIGFKTATVPFEVRERFAGKSQYSFRRMLTFALDGITAFSVVPLRLVAIAGALIVLVSMCFALYALAVAVRGIEVPGWVSTVLPIYALGGFQILTLGVVAEYVGRIYTETKARPRFIKEEELL